jgi:hypothetical protein
MTAAFDQQSRMIKDNEAATHHCVMADTVCNTCCMAVLCSNAAAVPLLLLWHK